METKIRVAEIVEATTGGTRRHVTDLVCALDPDRFAVTVFCSTRRDSGFLSDIERMRRHGVDVVVVPMARPIFPFHDAVAFARLFRAIRRGRFDVVHTHSSKAGFLGRLAARAAGVRTIVHTPHTFAFQMGVNPVLKGFYRALERLVAPWTDRLICVCDAEREAAREAGLDGEGRCVVIPNGVPESAFCESNDRPAIRQGLGLRPDERVAGTVGRVAPQKGSLDLVEAAALAVGKMPAVRFVLIGDGSLMPAVRRRVAALGLSRQVLLTGAVENAAALMPAFDVLVLPSRWESFPYVLLEAMAAGLPVVATRVGGVSEAVLHGETGLLVPPGNPEALAGAILELLADPARRRALGAAARKRASDRYRLASMVARLEFIYAGA